MPPIERALLRTLPWLVGGLAASLVLLLLTPGDEPIVLFTVQLLFLVGFSLGLTYVLVEFGDEPWFVAKDWSHSIRPMASGVAIVVLVTGTVGLVTLASSAAAGYDPSLQFLQLLSALDIAWVGAALMLGVYRSAGRAWAVGSAGLLGMVCIWSIVNYLNIVGFGKGGAWIASGSDLARYVIPFDVAAAVIAVGAFLVGVRFQSQPTEQPSPQS